MPKHQIREGHSPHPSGSSIKKLSRAPPYYQPIKEIMATSVSKCLDSDLEEGIEEIPEEVIDAEEDSDETFELPETEKPT